MQKKIGLGIYIFSSAIWSLYDSIFGKAGFLGKYYTVTEELYETREFWSSIIFVLYDVGI